MIRLASVVPSDERFSVRCRISAESGFSLVEFLLSSLILVIIAGAVFDLLGRTQRTASYQTEVQAVIESTRIAMETVERTISQAGNDPLQG